MSIRNTKFGNFLSTVKKTFSRIIDFNIGQQNDYNELNELNNSNKNNLNDTPSLSNNDNLSPRFKFKSDNQKITSHRLRPTASRDGGAARPRGGCTKNN